MPTRLLLHPRPGINVLSTLITTVPGVPAAAAAAIGVVWFGRLCTAMGLAPPDAFRAWLALLGPELLKGPFNHEERQQVRHRAFLLG
jgi:hypothetical protein